ALLHAEFGRAVLDEHVELLERALVEQEFDALARGQLAALVLGLDARLAAAEASLLPAFLQPVEDIFHRAPARVESASAWIAWSRRNYQPSSPRKRGPSKHR